MELGAWTPGSEGGGDGGWAPGSEGGRAGDRILGSYGPRLFFPQGFGAMAPSIWDPSEG